MTHFENKNHQTAKQISTWLTAEMEKTEFGTLKAELVMHDGKCKYIELSKSEKIKLQ